MHMERKHALIAGKVILNFALIVCALIDNRSLILKLEFIILWTIVIWATDFSVALREYAEVQRRRVHIIIHDLPPHGNVYAVVRCDNEDDFQPREMDEVIDKYMNDEEYREAWNDAITDRFREQKAIEIKKNDNNS